jgi:hypothetical protein
VFLEWDQQVMHGSGAIGHGHDQADAVIAGGLWRFQRLRQANDGKAGAVEGVVLDCVGGDVQAEFTAGALAGNGRPGRVGGGQAGALGVAGGGAPLGMGQVGG